MLPGFIPFPPGAPSITYEGQASVTGSTASPFTGNLPSGIVQGDLLIAFVFRSASGQTYTFPAGWTLVSGASVSWASGVLACYYRIADGSEGSTISISSSVATTQRYFVTVLRFSGARNVAPESSSTSTASNAAPDTNSVTPSWGLAETFFLSAWGLGTNGQVTASAAPTGYTDFKVENFISPPNTRGMGVAGRKAVSTSDNPGAWSVTTNDVTNAWGGFTIAIRPFS